MTALYIATAREGEDIPRILALRNCAPDSPRVARFVSALYRRGAIYVDRVDVTEKQRERTS